MRNSRKAPDGIGGSAIVAGLRGPCAAHAAQPVFMFGQFPTPLSTVASAQTADALLGIREDADAATAAVHPHGHAATPTRDGQRFMFGVAPEQSPATLPIAPVYYFWDIGPG